MHEKFTNDGGGHKTVDILMRHETEMNTKETKSQ